MEGVAERGLGAVRGVSVTLTAGMQKRRQTGEQQEMNRFLYSCFEEALIS